MPEIADNLQPIENQSFEKTKQSFSRYIHMMPSDIAHPLDNPSVHLVSNTDFIKANVQMQQMQGIPTNTARRIANNDAQTKIAFCSPVTREIFVQELHKEVKDALTNVQRFYLFQTAYASTILIQPHAEDIDIATAAKAINTQGHVLESVLDEMGFDPRAVRLDYYGRMINIRDEEGKYLKSMGSNKDKVIQGVTADVFAHYVMFLDYADKNNELDKYKKDPVAALRKYKTKNAFKSLVDGDNINAPFIIEAAIQFDGFENLVRQFIGSQSLDYEPFEYEDGQAAAIRDLCMAYQSQELIHRQLRIVLLEAQNQAKNKDKLFRVIDDTAIELAKQKSKSILEVIMGFREAEEHIVRGNLSQGQRSANDHPICEIFDNQLNKYWEDNQDSYIGDFSDLMKRLISQL